MSTYLLEVHVSVDCITRLLQRETAERITIFHDYLKLLLRVSFLFDTLLTCVPIANV